MISKELRIGAFGDVHLGHHKTPSLGILENLRQAFPDNAETGDLDAIVIEGDLFDRLLTVPDPQVVEIQCWIIHFLRVCQRRDIDIWAVEGTPSHEWRQLQMLVTLNEQLAIGARVHYVSQLSIVYMERFGVNVLFVPDEWRPETDDTWVEIQQLLKEHHLEQVDFAVMHGAFEHQLPSNVVAPTHRADRFLSIVKHYVFIGHVHVHTVFERIIAVGSFDRLTHGEEGPKGHVRVVVKKDGDDEIRFIENKGAKLYKTIDCTGMELDQALEKVSTLCERLPAQSHVRIAAATADPILVSLDTLIKAYPLIHFSSKSTTRKEVNQQTLIDMRQRYQPVAITRANLPELLLGRLPDLGLTEAQVGRAGELLNEYLDRNSGAA